jgi:hypothetical protein
MIGAGVALIASFFLAGTLHQLGSPRTARRHTLLVKFKDRGLHRAALDSANWSYTTGDGEASFWVR